RSPRRHRPVSRAARDRLQERVRRAWRGFREEGARALRGGWLREDGRPGRFNREDTGHLRADTIHASIAHSYVALLVAVVFASEGIQKFLYLEQLGAGRFARIGIPYPGMMGPFVGIVEIVCGGLLLAG